MLNDKCIKTSIDKFAAGVCSRYECLSAVSHMADNLPTEQLEDISSSDDDETETYDVDELLHMNLHCPLCRCDRTVVMQLYLVKR